MLNDDKIMTLEEVAEYLRVKPQTIYSWAQERRYLLQSWARNNGLKNR